MSKETKPRWKNVDVQGKVTLYIPPRMRPSNVIGDSLAYREAFKNEYLEIIIVYGDADSCAVPKHLQGRTTYAESSLEINGRKAKLGIDRKHEPKLTVAYLCFPETSNTGQLKVSAICKGKKSLALARQVFGTIEFK